MTEFGIVTLIRPVQYLNKLAPILVRELGILISVIKMHPVNTPSPNSLIVFGNVLFINTKLEQRSNAWSPIVVIPYGILIDVKSCSCEKA